MKTQLLTSLEKTIQEWIENTAEDEGRPDGLFTEKTSTLMATAAAAVYDANFDGQAFAKSEARP